MIRKMCGVVLLALAAGPLQAQVVSGRVMEARSGWPVPYATVTVLDAGGRTVGQSSSDGQGEYRVDLRAPGRYRIRAERQGYRPRAFALMDVREGREVRRDIRLSPGVVRTGDDAGRGLLPPRGLPAPIPGVPPATGGGGPSTSRAPSGGTDERPAVRTAPAGQPRRGTGARPAPRPSGGRGGTHRDGARRTP